MALAFSYTKFRIEILKSKVSEMLKLLKYSDDGFGRLERFRYFHDWLQQIEEQLTENVTPQQTRRLRELQNSDEHCQQPLIDSIREVNKFERELKEELG